MLSWTPSDRGRVRGDLTPPLSCRFSKFLGISGGGGKPWKPSFFSKIYFLTPPPLYQKVGDAPVGFVKPCVTLQPIDSLFFSVEGHFKGRKCKTLISRATSRGFVKHAIRSLQKYPPDDVRERDRQRNHLQNYYIFMARCASRRAVFAPHMSRWLSHGSVDNHAIILSVTRLSLSCVPKRARAPVSVFCSYIV